MVLSLDQSITSSGYVLWEDNQVSSLGALRKPKEISNQVHQLRWVVDSVESLIKANSVTLVIMEGLPFSMQSASVRILAALFYMLLNLFDLLGVEVVIVPPSEVKKAAGSGKLSKSEVIAALPTDVLTRIQKQGYKKTTGLSDIADAYFLFIAYSIRKTKIQE